MRGVTDILKVEKGEIIQEDRDEIAKQKQKQKFSGQNLESQGDSASRSKWSAVSDAKEMLLQYL